MWCAWQTPLVQHGVPAHVVKFDSQPSSGLGAAGSLQFPQPALQVELHTPFAHEAFATFEPEHPRPHCPQSAGLLVVLVSHPLDGSPVQCPKPPAQVSVQSGLHVPLIGLQQVFPLHTTAPGFFG